jgi:hypothetical protein
VQLTQIRDLCVAAACLGIAMFATNEFISDRVNTAAAKRKRADEEAAGRATMKGDYGDVYRVEGDHYSNGGERSKYVRPATEAEFKATETSEGTFGERSGVFAVTADGEFVYPDDERWTIDLGKRNLTYYRVG